MQLGMDDFWHHSPESGFPPKSVAEPDQYDGGPNLNVVCTQLSDRTPYAQRKLVDRWCKALPGMKGVRILWFNSRVPQLLFDAACRVPGLEGLYVKWSGIKTLAALHEARDLRYLHLGSSPGIESMEPLGAMTQLRWLDIENFKKISRPRPAFRVDSVGWSLRRGKHVDDPSRRDPRPPSGSCIGFGTSRSPTCGHGTRP